MKVRFYKDTIRVRLSRSEVAALAEGRAVSQTTHFSTSARFVATLQPDAACDAIRVKFDAMLLMICLPVQRAREWSQSDEVGIESVQEIDAAQALHLLIEKDFQCLHGTSNENHDTFLNPLA